MSANLDIYFAFNYLAQFSKTNTRHYGSFISRLRNVPVAPIKAFTNGGKYIANYNVCQIGGGSVTIYIIGWYEHVPNDNTIKPPKHNMPHLITPSR